MTPETITCAVVVLLLVGLAIYGLLRCRHDWKRAKFQALNGGTSYQCTKCGKYRHNAPDDFVGEHMSHETGEEN